MSEANKPNYYHSISSPLVFSPPKSIEELKRRLDNLLGRSIAELAILAKVEMPESNIIGKGFTGQIIELFLGANAHNLSEPDFTNLGIELKTLPVGFDLMPNESTFVCLADINPERYIPFEESAVWHKLQQILFVMILAPKGLSIGQRTVVGYFFYEPKGKDKETLNADYDEFQELIRQGRIQEVNASLGNILQLRPKAANSKITTSIRNDEGEIIQTKPRGYYIRPFFTKSLVAQFLSDQNIQHENLEHFNQLKRSFSEQEQLADEDESEN